MNSGLWFTGNDPDFFYKGSGIPEFRINSGTTFLSVNWKFPETCFVIAERSGKFRFTEKSFQKVKKNVKNILK